MNHRKTSKVKIAIKFQKKKKNFLKKIIHIVSKFSQHTRCLTISIILFFGAEAFPSRLLCLHDMPLCLYLLHPFGLSKRMGCFLQRPLSISATLLVIKNCRQSSQKKKELPPKSMSTTLFFYGCSWFNNIDPILVSLIGSSVKHVQCHLNAYVIDSCHDKTIHIELINITAEN